MKCYPDVSVSSSMSGEGFPTKLRLFVLVINTADLINVRATPSLGISHALTAPVALFTTYILLGTMVVGAARQHYASKFLQIYALVACCCVQLMFSITVFKALKASHISAHQAALVLQGVLPMIAALALLVDFTGFILANRQLPAPPPLSVSSTTDSRN